MQSSFFKFSGDSSLSLFKFHEDSSIKFIKENRFLNLEDLSLIEEKSHLDASGK